MQTLLISSELDHSKVKFGPVDTNEKKGNNALSFISVKYEDDMNNMIVLQLPELKSSFCQLETHERFGKSNKTSLSFQLDSGRSSVQHIIDFIAKIEEAACNFVHTSEIFGKKDLKDVKSMLVSCIKPVYKKDKPKEINTAFPPSLRLNLPVQDNVISVDAVDNDEQPFDINSKSLKDCFVTAMVTLSCLWISENSTGKQFGLSMKVHKLRVVEPSNAIENEDMFMFRTNELNRVGMTDDEEGEDCEQMLKPSKQIPTKNTCDLLSDSD